MALNDDKGGKPAKPPSPVPEKRGGWLSRIAPGISRLMPKRDTPDNLWVKDPDTGEMIYRSDLEAALWVTPSGRHMRIAPNLRFAYTFDDGKFEKLATPKTIDDPLKFSDLKPYPELLAAARKATGEHEAMTVAVGQITGIETIVAVQNFAFRGGSFGLAVGEAFIFAAEEAVRRQAPMVVFTASGGARQQEGTLALMQMARTTIAVQFLKEQALPYIVVMTDPTTAGVLASYAMLGDVQIAEPGALIGFAGRRVIEETIRETLPPGFQTAEFLVERGGLDLLVSRGEMRETLGRILATLLLGEPAATLPDARQVTHDYEAIRASDTVISRLRALHPTLIDLSTSRIERILEALGRPQDKLPPVIHVAGTNGKGSTIAVLRAIAEAAGMRAHALTSPHLVRYAERIRVAGALITDDSLSALIDEVEAANAGRPISFFEIGTALALLAFARTSADLTLIEVGLGGRFDATNVFDAPAVSVITPVDYDHLEMLGPELAKIAWEKAGVIKKGRPVVCARQPDEALEPIEAEVQAQGADLWLMGREIDAWSERGRLLVQTPDRLLDLPLPGLFGQHQVENAGLAVCAALRLNDDRLTEDAIGRGVAAASWAGRFQRLKSGPFGAKAVAAGADLWLDGAHNPHGGRALAEAIRTLRARDGRAVALIVGMLARKNAAGFFEALRGSGASVYTVPFTSPTATDPAELEALAQAQGLDARTALSVEAALDEILKTPPAPHIIICGSLHFVGDILAADPVTWPV